MDINNNGGKQENGSAKIDQKWGLATRFGKRAQPSSEAKKAGWAKSKRNRELTQYLLSLEFVGKSEGFRMACAQYFGIPFDEMENMTNEAVMQMKQIAKAIETGDTQAYAAIMERAYGKPKEFNPLTDEEDAALPPVIEIHYTGNGPQDTPPITESEDTNEHTLSV